MGRERWEHLRRPGRLADPHDHRPPAWILAIYEYLERLLLHAALLGLVVLMLFQLLQTQVVVRQLLSPLERMEGQDPGAWYPAPGAWQAGGTVAGPAGTTVAGPADASVPAAGVAAAGAAPDAGSSAEAAPVAAPAATAAAVRGRVTVVLLSRPAAADVKLLVAGEAAGDFAQGRVTVTVLPGQEVAVDGRETDVPLTFRVVGADGLAVPALGSQVTTHGDIRSLGQARLR